MDCKSSPLVPLLSVASNLEDIHANLPSSGFNDEFIIQLLNDGGLKKLKRLVITPCLCPSAHLEMPEKLTSTSIFKLFESTQISYLGDLRLWSLDEKECNMISTISKGNKSIL